MALHAPKIPNKDKLARPGSAQLVKPEAFIHILFDKGVGDLAVMSCEVRHAQAWVYDRQTDRQTDR